ncbi:hypothetical protein OAN24_04260 [Pseudodesulfovibrio sp.]|nr:hypothetical protein [Pseudodesulfovibrio sp.]
MKIFRILASIVSVVGLCLLVLVLMDWHNGILAGDFFPDVKHTPKHHLGGLLLALPVPLHVIFIGLIVQKKWLSPSMARFAWVGIVLSGMWLGVSLAVKLFWLPLS